MTVDVEWTGSVSSGFEPVADAFERNFLEHGEVGASFAAVVDGEMTVDLWGGIADRREGRPWDGDTLQLIFSGTKGLVAICLLTLIDRGHLDLDSTVATYWPEFGAAEKGAVTVRELVTHTSRLSGVEQPVGVEDITDDRAMAGLVAAQRRSDDPRARSAYHALTFGWLCGELIRRIDGRSVGRFLEEEIVRPLGLEAYIGLPAELEPRVSRLELADDWGDAVVVDPETTGEDHLRWSTWANPQVWTSESFPWNSAAFRRAELPAANAIASARSLARLYASLDTFLSSETLTLGGSLLEARLDPLLQKRMTYGVGFELQTDLKPFGPPPGAFGHTGAGGSCHGCWPEERVGFSYAMNLMRNDHGRGDPRPRALLDALYRCVKAGRPR
jgi:CubicO group peptidase (beta-lactamase class C family)